jgi:phospholipid transport system substrate-binding protein
MTEPVGTFPRRGDSDVEGPSVGSQDANFAARPARHCSRLMGIFLVFFVIIRTAPVLAVEAGDPGAAAVVSRIIDAAKQGSLHDDAEAAPLARTSFDVAAIAKTILGIYWPTASARAKAEFIDALSSAMLANVFNLLEKHDGLDIAVGKTRGISNGDSLVETTMTETSGRVVNVDWRLRPCTYSLCVVDLIVNGASMAIQRRDEATAILTANNGVIDELSRRLRANPTNPFNW